MSQILPASSLPLNIHVRAYTFKKSLELIGTTQGEKKKRKINYTLIWDCYAPIFSDVHRCAYWHYLQIYAQIFAFPAFFRICMAIPNSDPLIGSVHMRKVALHRSGVRVASGECSDVKCQNQINFKKSGLPL